MSSRKPHIAVFFGGSPGSYDLSFESGHFVCQHIPREQFTVTPIHVLHDGSWQVPLGNLPSSGPIERMLHMLFQSPDTSVRSLPPAQGLQRLLQRPLAAMMTLLRGPGGDDGTLHATGTMLGIPVLGCDAGVSLLTHNKQHLHAVLSDFAALPDTLFSSHHVTDEELVTDSRERFSGPVFVKAAVQENSYGTELVSNPTELAAAINRTRKLGTVLIQERARGTELAITVVPNSRGGLLTLPTARITHARAPFYDYLAKRRPGRVHVAADTDISEHTPLVHEAEEIAREVYHELGCRGIVTIDVVADDHTIDVLDVNTVPSFTAATPVIKQLKAGRVSPATLLHTLITQTIDPR